MAEAFAFIKGRDSGKHSDVITEKEFAMGVSRLELTLLLQVGSAASGLRVAAAWIWLLESCTLTLGLDRCVRVRQSGADA
eukprot:1274443-Rhodomonas_salina.1